MSCDFCGKPNSPVRQRAGLSASESGCYCDECFEMLTPPSRVGPLEWIRYDDPTGKSKYKLVDHTTEPPMDICT